MRSVTVPIERRAPSSDDRRSVAGETGGGAAERTEVGADLGHRVEERRQQPLLDLGDRRPAGVDRHVHRRDHSVALGRVPARRRSAIPPPAPDRPPRSPGGGSCRARAAAAPRRATVAAVSWSSSVVARNSARSSSSRSASSTRPIEVAWAGNRVPTAIDTVMIRRRVGTRATYTTSDPSSTDIDDDSWTSVTSVSMWGRPTSGRPIDDR